MCSSDLPSSRLLDEFDARLRRRRRDAAVEADLLRDELHELPLVLGRVGHAGLDEDLVAVPDDPRAERGDEIGIASCRERV